MTWQSTKLGDIAPGRVLRTYAPHDPFTAALQDMAEHDFSQLVVRTDDGIQLLTVDGIARWLAQWAEAGKVTLAGVELQEVLECEYEDNVEVLSASAAVRDAQEAFERAIREGRPRLYAVVVTSGGSPTDTALGIITPQDLVE